MKHPPSTDSQTQKALEEIKQSIAHLPEEHQPHLISALERLQTSLQNDRQRQDGVQTETNRLRLSVNGKTSYLYPEESPIQDISVNLWKNIAARNAFLVQLSDRLRPLANPTAIQETVTRTAMENFHSDRCYYCEIIGDDAVIRRDASREDLPSIAGVYPLNVLPIFKAMIEAGHPFMIQDTATFGRMDEPLRQLAERFQIVSVLGVPVIKESLPAGILFFTQTAQREWTNFEVELAVEIAERTWEAVERAQAEDALRISEERYRTLFEKMDQGFCIIEKVETPPDQLLDFRYVVANPAFERHTGLSDVVGKTIRDLVPNPEPERIGLYDQVLQTGRYQHFQSHAKSLDLWIEADVYPVQTPGQIAVLFTNINQRKQAELAAAVSERALRESEERFRQLANAMPQLVWTARPDGTVDYYNQRYHEYDGIGPLKENIWEWSPVLHPDDQQATVDVWNHAVKTGEMYQIEHRVRMKDGTYRWHLSRGIPAKDGDGKIIRWYGTATDIHIQKLNEEKVRRSNQELEQFAFIASHDLQEPLRKIIMFGNSLRNQLHGKVDDTAEFHLSRMQNAAERMQVMINGLLELSRISSRGGNFAPIDLTRVANDAVSDLEARIRLSNAQVIIGELPTVVADELQMRMLFQNLIGNAIKFHKPDVNPIVKVYARMDHRARQPQWVEITVEDNGIGFSQEFSERIFQPFQRLHGRSAYEGTGLGLSIAKKIVERHQGFISAHGTPDQGSVFTITLPTKQAG